MGRLEYPAPFQSPNPLMKNVEMAISTSDAPFEPSQVVSKQESTLRGRAGEQNGAGKMLRISLNWSKSFTQARILLLGCLLVAPCILSAQYNDEPASINQGPEAQFLELVDLVAEPDKQLALLETFSKQFPKYPAMSTVDAQKQELFIALKQWDRALEIGAKLLTLDESDIETIRRNLQAAQGKADVAGIAKWTERLKQLEPPEGSVSADSTVRLPFVDDIPADLAAVDLSSIPKQQRDRVEAFLFNRALDEKDLVRRLQLLSLFERQFPSSSHLGKVRYMFYTTHLQRQDHTKALAAAEAILERDKSREDVVFYAAQHYFVTKRFPEKVLTFSALLLDMAATKSKPEEITNEVWDKQKSLMIHQAHWMIASVQLQHQRWAEAEKSLKAALASAPAGSDMTEVFLLNLGWANYKLRNVTEALKYYQQCVALKGPNQASASQSITSIKSEYNLQ
jgi:tetratricopeptide (TPR) repeat protein